MLPSLRRPAGVLALTFWVTTTASANDDFDMPMPEVLTPMRLSEPLSETPAAVTVITADQLRQWGIHEFSDIFAYVPGMFTARSADYRRNRVVYHSGELNLSRRLEVLVNGQSRYETTFSQIDWQQLGIAIEDVDRIEITRGPGSASYGFNAFQGMIHIFTRHPADSSRIALAAHYQSDQGRQGYASLASSHEDFDQRLSLWGQRVGEFGGYHDRENPPDLSQTKAANWQAQLRPDANNRLQVEAGRSLNQQEGNSNASLQQNAEILRNTRDHLMLEWQQDNPDSQWQLRSYWSRDRKLADTHLCIPAIAIDPSTTALYASNPDLYTLIGYAPLALQHADAATQANMTAFYQALAAGYLDTNSLAAIAGQYGFTNMTVSAEELSLARTAAYNALANQALDSSTCGNLNTDSHEERLDLEWQYTRQWHSNLRSVQGIGFRRDQARSDFYFGDNNIHLDHWLAFGNLEYRQQNWLFNAGTSANRTASDRWLWSPRVGINRLLSPTESLRLQVARSYRSPDLAERYLKVQATLTDLSRNYSGLSSYRIPFTTGASLWDTNMRPEQLNSIETGYFGAFYNNRLMLDVRLFQERLLNLISGQLTSNSGFDTDGFLFLRGAESQLDWHYNANSNLRITALLQDRNSNNRDNLVMGAERSLRTIWSHQQQQWQYRLGAMLDQSAITTTEGTYRQRRALAGTGVDTTLGNWTLTSLYDADAGTVMYQHNPRWLWQADWRIDW